MFIYFFKRLGMALLTFLIILIVVYFLQSLWGKSPFTEEALKNASSGRGSRVETIDPIKEYGFDRPIIVRFLEWFWNAFFRWDFGKIYSDPALAKITIPSLFFGPLKWTILVSFPAFILSSILGILLGTLAAYKRGRWQDSAITIFVTIFVALPSFIIAPIAILLGVKIGLPFEFKDPNDTSAFTTFTSLIIPISVFTLSALAGYTLLVRNQVVTVLTSNQVLIAKSKGLSQWKIFTKHVLRNASVIIVGVILASYIGLLSGSIILEKFFRIPGTSSIIVDYTERGEINVIMFSLYFFTGLSLLTSIIVDMSYAWMDPRIRIGNQSDRNIFKELKAKYLRNKDKKSLNTINVGGQDDATE